MITNIKEIDFDLNSIITWIINIFWEYLNGEAVANLAPPEISKKIFQFIIVFADPSFVQRNSYSKNYLKED